ncbi:MAG: HutD family protein [Thermoleophilia bacterium]|nr:HutD family protein [Thermoleophilia bacterium]
MPWKNGQGSTTELAVEPTGAALEAFDWRLSIAELRGSGPFSTFPGYDRIIVQLDGPPMTLTHGSDAPVALEQLVPHAFSGDADTTCAVDGVAHDFNLIVRRGVLRPMLTVHRLAEGEELACEGGAVTVLHVLKGGLTGAARVQLNAGDTRVEDVADRTSLRATRRAVVLLATLTY